MITHNGCKVGLITTKGFEDTTEIMRAIGRVDGLSDDEIKHVTWITKPEPFVPRERIIGVRERMDYQGNEIVPLNWDDVMEAIRRLMEEDKVDAIAVSLMHAWANPRHEEEIRALTAEADPQRKVYWSFGSSLSQVAGEYARTNTAILNSYLGPTVEALLKRSREQIAERRAQRAAADYARQRRRGASRARERDRQSAVRSGGRHDRGGFRRRLARNTRTSSPPTWAERASTSA